MQSFPKRTAALGLCLSLWGCGDISNGIFEEDSEFLSAFPDDDRQSVGFESSATAEGDSTGAASRAAIGERADLVELSILASGNVNAFIFSLLDAIDHVRELKPAERTENSRRWGPFDWQCGVSLTILMSRDAGVYSWSVSGRRSGEEDATLLYGTHYAGSSVAGGDGQFTWDHARYSEWCGTGETGLLTVDYDNREGVDLVVQIDDFAAAGEEPADKAWSYTRTEAVGDYQFRTQVDLADDGSDEEATVTVRDRWVPGTGGRSDAAVTGGGFGDATWQWSQCWDSAGRLTWEGDNLGLIEESGNGDLCVYTDVVEVNRI